MKCWPLRWLLLCSCQFDSPAATPNEDAATTSPSTKSPKAQKIPRPGTLKAKASGYEQLGFCNRSYLDKTPHDSRVGPSTSLSSEDISWSSSSFEHEATVQERFRDISHADGDNMVRRLDCTSTDEEVVDSGPLAWRVARAIGAMDSSIKNNETLRRTTEGSAARPDGAVFSWQTLPGHRRRCFHCDRAPRAMEVHEAKILNLDNIVERRRYEEDTIVSSTMQLPEAKSPLAYDSRIKAVEMLLSEFLISRASTRIGRCKVEQAAGGPVDAAVFVSTLRQDIIAKRPLQREVQELSQARNGHFKTVG
ncbi:hypothetical protein BIW11_00849 [Tropilaelaps mercedesae]|uniref:Uncharacterized protein n=1 Tax=Tropilaelaps mercedesae TaxID=418985 RepID=A0A1V9XNI0_9ACAR|nr:hypothetical protein BIW11_00849 [Tropilaelaps mercedesae]